MHLMCEASRRASRKFLGDCSLSSLGRRARLRREMPSGAISMRTTERLMLALLVSMSTTPALVDAQTSSDPKAAAQSSAAPDPNANDDSPDWLFPIAELNKHLPSWLRFGGQYRNRFEGPMGIGLTGPDDYYVLDRLRGWVNIQPEEWLRFHAEVQDAPIFFNHHLPNPNPHDSHCTLSDSYALLC